MKLNTFYHEIKDEIQSSMIDTDIVRYRKDLNYDKVLNIKKKYKRMESIEDFLFMLDESAFNSAKRGVLFTESGVHFRDMWESDKYFAYKNFAGYEVEIKKTEDKEDKEGEEYRVATIKFTKSMDHRCKDNTYISCEGICKLIEKIAGMKESGIEIEKEKLQNLDKFSYYMNIISKVLIFTLIGYWISGDKIEQGKIQYKKNAIAKKHQRLVESMKNVTWNDVKQEHHIINRHLQSIKEELVKK
jgi:hypothetical protein